MKWRKKNQKKIFVENAFIIYSQYRDDRFVFTFVIVPYPSIQCFQMLIFIAQVFFFPILSNIYRVNTLNPIWKTFFKYLLFGFQFIFHIFFHFFLLKCLVWFFHSEFRLFTRMLFFTLFFIFQNDKTIMYYFFFSVFKQFKHQIFKTTENPTADSISYLCTLLFYSKNQPTSAIYINIKMKVKIIEKKGTKRIM